MRSCGEIAYILRVNYFLNFKFINVLIEFLGRIKNDKNTQIKINLINEYLQLDAEQRDKSLISSPCALKIYSSSPKRERKRSDGERGGAFHNLIR